MPPSPWSSAAQSKCTKSHQDRHPSGSYLNTLVNLNQTHREPFPNQGPPTLKTLSPYLFPLCSSTAPSKCAKSHLEPLARDEAPSWAGPCSSTPWLNFNCKLNIWSNLLKTHRSPAPYQGPPLLKRASPYHHPPWSSACMSKCAK